MMGKHFTKTLNKVELRINCVQINHFRPVKKTRRGVYVPSDPLVSTAVALLFNWKYFWG